MRQSLASSSVVASFLALTLVAATNIAAADEWPARPAAIRLDVRWQAPVAEGGDSVDQKTASRELMPAKSAILICDVWDKHWCISATRRCDALARKMAPLIDQARARGVRIIHAPSDTLEFYRDHPARCRALEVAVATPPFPIESGCGLDRKREGSLPIDDSDGGCDCLPPCKNVNFKAWSRQHPAIAIDHRDLISDNGKEIYNYLVAEKVDNIIYMGVHTNMCVLGRSFGIRQMTRLGFNTLLVRDLTDTMYNPRLRPMVDHEQGTELVVRHVERYWCPTTLSAALAEGLR